MTEGDINTPITDDAELPDAVKASPSADVRSDVIDTLNAEQEAEKRGITAQQWQDVLQVSENSQYGITPDAFEYDGDGNITYYGALHLFDSALVNLPKNLKVTENLDLKSTPISELPEGLKVGTYIELTACDNLDPEKTLEYLFRKISDGEIKAAVISSFPTDLVKKLLPSDLKMDKHGANVIYKDASVLDEDENGESYLMSTIGSAKVLAEGTEYDSDDSDGQSSMDADIQDRH